MKIVAGRSLCDIRSLVIAVAIKEGKSPDCVDEWSKWFKSQACDYQKLTGDDKAKRCTGCQKGAQCEGKQSV